MTNRPKALPMRAQSLAAGRDEAARAFEVGAFDGPLGASAVQPLDFDGTAALSEAELRSLATNAKAPGARLAACWRLMIRGQALPSRAPSEGVRRLTLLNLATQQDLELLEVLLCLDPSSGVRAQAAMLLWRVARDRDRVVELLVSRLAKETSQEVLLQLLELDPALPFEKIRPMARSYLSHPSLEMRRAGWNHWVQNGAPIDEEVGCLVWAEPSPDLQAWCLRRWAEGPDPRAMLRAAQEHRPAVRQVLDALSRAGRSLQLAEVWPLLDDYNVEPALKLVRGPFDAVDRARLVSLTGLLLPPSAPPRSPGAPRRAGAHRPIGRQLWRCLESAYSGLEASALTDRERAWASLLEEQAKAPEQSPRSGRPRRGAAPRSRSDDARRLLGLLRP